MELIFLIFLLASISVQNGVWAFNLDVSTRLVHRYDLGTKFGYSVDLYSDRSAQWVLVGAPQAQTRQPGVTRGGAVFKCSTVGQACYEIKFDQTGASTGLNGSVAIPIDSKSDQWFGATVSASRHSDVVVACAPRYTFFYSTFDKKEPVGTCFAARNNFETIQEFAPCRGPRWGYHRWGFCMAGFSAAIGLDGELLFMGAPGAYYWQGAVATQHLDSIDNGEPLISRESPAQYDDQYLGYAVASGELDGQEGSDVAVGVPRGNGLLGLVAIFDAFNRNLKNISGEQVGSYFGAAIAVSDLNNDGLDDLIVGAPLFTQQLVIRGSGPYNGDQQFPTQDGGGVQTGGYEAGKVYIFWQKEDHYFYQNDFTGILGKKDWARFGHAVAAVGDLNGDGFNDFLVGAPYDSEDGRGAVHVFNGNGERQFDKPSQIIYGEDIRDNIKTFGFSLAGGVDVDGNEYPDVVIGAYASDRAILFKTRPVVSVSGSVSLVPGVIDLNGADEASSTLTVCMNYTGRGAPPNLNLRLEIELDAAQAPENRRAHLVGHTGPKHTVQSVGLRQNIPDCTQQYYIRVPNSIRDKLSPIVVNVSSFVSDQGRGFGGQLTPVKNALLPAHWTAELHIANNCGQDQLCIPDLQLKAEPSKPSLARGVSDRVNLTVTIYNEAKDAHQAKFYVNAPRGARWVGTFAEEFRYRIHCTPPNSTNNGDYSPPTYGGYRRGQTRPTTTQNEFTRLECDIGNPFRSQDTLVLNVEYETNNVPVNTKELVFNLEVNSTLPDDPATRADNMQTVAVPLESNIKIRINSIASPDQIPFYQEDDRSHGIDLNRLTERSLVGPDVSHTYSVINDPSSATRITSAKLDVFFPHLTQTNDFLLYVLYDIYTEGNIRCEAVQPHNINPRDWVLPPRYAGPGSAYPPGYPTTRRPRQPGVRRGKRQAPNDPNQPNEPVEPELGIGGGDEVENDRSALNKAFVNFVKQVKEGVSGLSSSWTSVKELAVDCNQMHCMQWTCTIFDLDPQQAATVTVNSTLFLRTILKQSVPKATISSMAVVEVTKVPYQLPKDEKMPVEAKTATTVVQRLSHDGVARGIPSWMIIVAILTGLTLLILLALLLWRLGFFKRKRPPRGQAKLKAPETPEGRGQYSTYSPSTQEYGSSYGRGQQYGQQL